MSILATAIATLGPAAAKYFGARAAAKQLRQDPNEVSAQFDQLKKDMPQYGVGSAWNEYLAMSKQDPAADMERQIAAEQEASSIGALKSGGAKALLGGLGASQRAAAQNRMGIEADSARRQQSALQSFAGQQQRVDDANTRAMQQLGLSQFEAERGAEQYNRNLDAQQKMALGDAIGAGLGMFGQGLLKKGAPDTGGGSFGAGAFGGAGNTLQSGYGGLDSGFDASQYGGLTALQKLQMGFKQGGMLTPGEFSHETNPIDMMKEGAKVGEMTGGEAILNPEQQKKTASQSPYFRKLMREFAMRGTK